MRTRSLLLVSLLCCNFVYSQKDENLNRIVVYGNSVVAEKADQISLRFNVLGTGQTLVSAVEATRNKSNEVVKFLKQNGFDENEFTTSHFVEGENSEKLMFSNKKDFKTNVEITLKTDKVNIIETVILGLNQMKIDVYDIRFNIKDEESLNRKAIRLAAENARVKAEILAKELNAKIDGLLFVEEINGFNVNVRGGRSSETGVYMDAFIQRTFVFEEKITRSASVKAIFNITKP